MKTITPEEVKVHLEEGKKLNLIDVREDDEVAEGMIPAAFIFQWVKFRNP